MTGMLILGLCGPAGAGKDTVADYLVSRYGFRKYSFTDILVEEAKKRGLEPTKDNLSKIGDELRKEGGMGVLAKKLWERIEKESPERVVIPNFRSPEEVEYIWNRCQCEKFVLILITAPPEIRYERVKGRDKYTGMTFSQFLERDRRDFNFKKMGEVFEMADYYLDNDSSLDELHSLVDELMEHLGIEPVN